MLKLKTKSFIPLPHPVKAALLMTGIFFTGATQIQAQSEKKEVVKKTNPLILDMVHHNPGETRYSSKYETPKVIKKMGYNGKVYFLFDSPTLAITWNSLSPDILPHESKARRWVDAKAKKIRQQQAACHAVGIKAYAMADLILFPKRLIKKYHIEKSFGNIQNPQTEKFLRIQLNEMFDQFSDLDGIVVRIGETYLQDAPYHKGSISHKTSAEKTIIPLIRLLREEVCVKRNKEVIFRTWLSFDKDLKTYIKVSQAIEPHPNLVLSVKHIEGDFHRSNPFSKVIGAGRHRQIVEVQCAREYEGKGAYPNYIAHGVIDGFEEHQRMPEKNISSLSEWIKRKPELYAGIWTWTRGGGWHGPFIKNELWCDLNAWVMAQWAADTSQTEESIFNRYAREKLNLKGRDLSRFRQLCLLSAEAVVRGRNSTYGDMDPWWTRDMGIGFPKVNKDPLKQARNLKQKDESIQRWQKIVTLAESIDWPDSTTKEFAVSSSYYGMYLYEIYRSLVYLSDAESKKDVGDILKWIQVYDKTWEHYRALPKTYKNVSSLYTANYKTHIRDNADNHVNRLRKKWSQKK